MRFKKIYLEISNLCNLSCSFCHGTKRSPKRMTVNEFSTVLPKLRPYSDFLYFHIMGEPLCHPELSQFFDMADEHGFRVIITTNGTLLKEKQELLLSKNALHKINVSLHAFEANDLKIPFDKYLDSCLSFGRVASETTDKIVVYRLWNAGGKEELNKTVLCAVKSYFPCDELSFEKSSSIKLGDRVFIERANKFDWPDISREDTKDNVFCYGLRDQIGILCDGTVVPCCLDCEGDIALGNIFEDNMENILASKRVKEIYDGFSKKRAVEELCRRCGYARRF